MNKSCRLHLHFNDIPTIQNSIFQRLPMSRPTREKKTPSLTQNKINDQVFLPYIRDKSLWFISNCSLFIWLIFAKLFRIEFYLYNSIKRSFVIRRTKLALTINNVFGYILWMKMCGCSQMRLAEFQKKINYYF